MNPIPESKKNHLWRKTVWHTDPETFPLGPHHFAEVCCCEESNGYAVWYVRRLAKEDCPDTGQTEEKTENGDYLLRYFHPTRRDAAIEFAVLHANSAITPEQIMAKLDDLARQAQHVTTHA